MTKIIELNLTGTQMITLTFALIAVVSYFIQKARNKAKEKKKQNTDIGMTVYVPLFKENLNGGGKMSEMDLRDYFAARALLASVSETQEVIPASFWDWVKSILRALLYMTFLEVKYKTIEDAYKQSAERSYRYADAFIAERAKAKGLTVDEVNSNNDN